MRYLLILLIILGFASCQNKAAEFVNSVDIVEQNKLLLERGMKAKQDIQKIREARDEGDGSVEDGGRRMDDGQKISNSQFLSASWRTNEIPNSKIQISKVDGELTYEYDDLGEKMGLLDRVMAELKGKRFRKQEDERKHRLDIDFSKENIEWNKYVVLYRVNAQSRALEEVLMDYGVPYRIIGGVKFYERKEVKDTLAYLWLLVNPNDFERLRRIINEPPRGIGTRSIDRLEKACKEQRMDIFTLSDNLERLGTVRAERREVFKRFVAMLAGVREKVPNVSVSEIIDLILTKSGYKDYLLDGSAEGKLRWENVQELKTVAKKYELLPGEEGLEAFLEEVALMTDIDSYDTKQSQAITLMTLHAAKGLEFPCVFMVGLEEGLFPHSNSLETLEELEEERRLCYVGITRAQERLYLSYARQRMLYGNIHVNPPSRFLEEMPEDLVDKFGEDG